MELIIRISVLFVIVFLLLLDLVHSIRRKESNKIETNLDDNYYEQNVAKHDNNRDDVISEVINDQMTVTNDLENWSGTNLSPSSDKGNQVFVKPNEIRGRRHRDIQYTQTAPEDLNAQLKALSGEKPRDIKGSPKDMVSIYNALVNELEDKRQIKSRLDALEVEMNKMSDVTRHIDVNAITSSKAASCSCPDAINREELEVVKVHQRRMYLMMNAQEGRHRDMLDLVKAYRFVTR